MLEICQNAAGSTDLATDRHGHDGPSWTPSSHPYAISSAAVLHYPRQQVWRIVIGTVRRGPLFQNTSTLGIWVLGSLLWTSWRTTRTDRHRHDGPSQAFVTPYLVRLPHLPSAAALRYHLRTVTIMTDRHKLRRWSLLHFFAQNLRIHFWTDFLQIKRNLYKN